MQRDKKDINLILNKIKKKEQIKLNLGVGRERKEGFIGVDINDGPKVDVIENLTDLPKKIPKNSVDEIYSRHVLEHFSREEVPKIIKLWVGMLKSGGKITLNFPDLDRYVDFYIANRDKISIEEFARWIYGNQHDQYDYHKAGFNAKYISDILIRNGLKIISVKEALVGNGIPPRNQSMIGTEIVAVKSN